MHIEPIYDEKDIKPHLSGVWLTEERQKRVYKFTKFLTDLKYSKKEIEKTFEMFNHILNIIS